MAPVVILWTDKDRQWEALGPRLRQELPHFLTLGPYEAEGGNRTGPAIWVRCMVERTLPAADWPANQPPILYLAGVSRQELRAVEECPPELQPLAELQYRGVFFTQVNAKDWTVSAFLGSESGGLGLDVARDRATGEAMLNALAKLADTPVAELRGRRLEAVDFHDILAPDMTKRLLRWLNDPKGTCESWKAEEWASFASSCRDKYGFDPEKDGELVAAEKLGQRDRGWGPVWARFAEAPMMYPNLPDLLRRAKPGRQDDLFFERDSWPQYNEESEAEVREKLMSLSHLASDAAANEIEKLEVTHGARRSWVWAALGQAPLAQALKPLAQLAQATRKKLGGASPEAMAATYINEGWQADAAVLDALTLVSRNADVEAVKAAVNSVYRPWLEAGALHLQELVCETPLSGYDAPPKEIAHLEASSCIVFADGLRFDVAQRLKAALEETGLVVQGGWRWVPLPPVTPTAKPAASPVADLLEGSVTAEQFVPAVKETGKALTIDRFRKLLEGGGFQVLRGHELGDPSGRAWTEYGEI
ncbi:MAG: BREX-1 system phosphatase PglZ type B, partial [Acidobacteriota bacterium]